VFDTKTAKMTALVWRLGGTYHYGPPTEKPRATAAVIEWAADP
jgi:hypothetical protein